MAIIVTVRPKITDMQLRIALLLLAALPVRALAAHSPYVRDDNKPPANCCRCGAYWRVTGFCAPIRGCYDPTKLKYYYYDRCRGWVPSCLEAFLAADDPAVTTCFFLPGFEANWRCSPGEYVENATSSGWLIYNRVAPVDRPFRLVLWAWPADRDQGERMLPNMRLKLARAEQYGWYLAWLVDRMNPQIPVGFVSDSLGASCLSGALHLLGGGAVRGTTLARVHPDRLPPSAAMIASTMSNRWLAVNGRHGRALAAVDRMVITVNPADRLLRLYDLADIGSSEALGATGIAGPLGPCAQRVRYMQVEPYLGVKHWWSVYLRSPPIVAAFRPYAFPLPAATDIKSLCLPRDR